MLLIGDRAPRHFAAEQLAILSNFAELLATRGWMADKFGWFVGRA